MPRVVVTTICKDETPEFIARWAFAGQDADYRVLVDTGSTDDAVECARDHGVIVHEISVQPWRFHSARNAGMALLPSNADLVLSMDVDEILQPGWRDVIENAPPAQRYSYEYIWRLAEDGTPETWFSADHIHSRHGWQWRHPVHEALYWVGDGPEPRTVHLPIRVEHRPDPLKSRAQYLPLLAQAVAEAPTDDRMAHYYARELFFYGQWDRARQEFVRHLALPTAVWSAERGQSYRYLAKMDDFPERWLLHAVAEDPQRREPWVDLVMHWHALGEETIAAGCAQRALMLTTRHGDYLAEQRAWDDDWLRSIAAGASTTRTLPMSDIPL